MRDLGFAIRLVAGAVGDPGDRTFYVEVETDTGLFSFVVEKLQVSALATRVRELLTEAGMSGSGHKLEPGGLTAPLNPEFRVAEIRMRADATLGLYRIEFHPVASDDAEGVLFDVPPGVLDVMVEPAIELVTSGRPLCPRCGLAIDPDGHPCPSANGDLRHHRP